MFYRAIHKAAGLIVSSRSMTLPDTFPVNILSREWDWWLVNGSLRLFQPSAEHWTAALRC